MTDIGVKKGFVSPVGLMLIGGLMLLAGAHAAAAVSCPPAAGDGAVQGADGNWSFPGLDMPDGRGGTIKVCCINDPRGAYFLAKLMTPGGKTKYIGKCPFGGGMNMFKKTYAGGKLTKYEWWSVDDATPDSDKNYHDYHVTTTFSDTGCKRSTHYTSEDPTQPLLCATAPVDVSREVLRAGQEPPITCCTDADGVTYCDELSRDPDSVSTVSGLTVVIEIQDEHKPVPGMPVPGIHIRE